jgi:hypothetical protein
MSEKRTFPNSDAQFDQFVKRSVPYISFNQDRLRIDHNYLKELIITQERWEEVFSKSQDPNIRTKTLTDEKNDLKTFIKSTMRKIFEDIPKSVLTDADRNTLNLPKRDIKPSPRGRIEKIPFVGITLIGGGEVKVRTRTNSDASRPSIYRLADGVEMRYCVSELSPANIHACNQSIVSKKAIFNFAAGNENTGKKLFAYFRYINLSNPANNGPWSNMETTIIP